MKPIDLLTNVLIVLLFVLAGMVAWYITTHGSAPWDWIATYWITLTAKNGLDCIKKAGK